MKKILLLVALCIAFAFANAQTLLTETFATGTMPAGWTTIDSDGDGFSTSVTMTAANGTVYVRYIPTAAGDDSGTVNFTCDGAATVAMPVTGHGRDCNNTPLPYEFHFDNMEQALCWTIIDANYDAHNLYGEIYFSLEDGFAVYGFNETNAADGLQTEVNVSNLAKGLYSMKVETESGTANVNFNVVR